MKTFHSAFKVTNNDKIAVEPVVGQEGLFAFRNAYSGPYNYFPALEEKSGSEAAEQEKPSSKDSRTE